MWLHCLAMAIPAVPDAVVGEEQAVIKQGPYMTTTCDFWMNSPLIFFSWKPAGNQVSCLPKDSSHPWLGPSQAWASILLKRRMFSGDHWARRGWLSWTISISTSSSHTYLPLSFWPPCTAWLKWRTLCIPLPPSISCHHSHWTFLSVLLSTIVVFFLLLAFASPFFHGAHQHWPPSSPIGPLLELGLPSPSPPSLTATSEPNTDRSPLCGP